MTNRRRLVALLPVAGFLLMGLSMPGCPGTQAMQQQIDLITQKQTSHDKAMQTTNAQIGQLSKDLAEARTLLAQVSETVLAQKKALEDMRASMQEMVDKMAKAKAAPAPAAKGKKKGR